MTVLLYVCNTISDTDFVVNSVGGVVLCMMLCFSDGCRVDIRFKYYDIFILPINLKHVFELEEIKAPALLAPKERSPQ